MPEKTSLSKKGPFADWLMRGVLTKLGDSFDNLTGRRWMPSSSLAASELIERIKKLLDAEAKEVPGKGTVVPHNIKLKMQWNKFSEDAEDALKTLETELLTAAVDHINDSLYYTYAPVMLEVKPDYFIEGVKLTVSFDDFADEKEGVEMNVTVPAINVADALAELDAKPAASGDTYIFRYEIKGEKKEKRFDFTVGQSLSVGRISANAFILDDASVSKSHASLAVGGDGSLSVADTGSTNGTFINDERIAYGKAMRLEEGDKVKFGTVKVAFEHVPRPIVTEQYEADAEASNDTVSIDGIEFKSKVSPHTPATETAPSIEMPETPVVAETSPAIPVPDQTVEIAPLQRDKTENVGGDLDETIRDEET